MTRTSDIKTGTARVKRMPEVRVGDEIQYRYSYGPVGFTQCGITTREVIEVRDGGAQFVVQGGFVVFADCVYTHISMHREAEGRKQEQEAAL